MLTQERGLSGCRRRRVGHRHRAGRASPSSSARGSAKLLGDLTAERRERVRSQERADVAAHLHDSVLQTLALLQQNADDPAAVATLARRQERDLRAWLYGDEDDHGDSLLAAAAGGRRGGRGGPPRDRSRWSASATPPLDSDVAALARAAREAMVNAAKHAGVGRVDVYAECDGRTAEVFVRDRGAASTPTQVADDRLGMRGSIVGRIERHGGTVTIRSAPGEGTEVRMQLPLSTSQEAPA